MKQIDSEVLVVGGGATGTGVARDLAMRGFKTVLVEKADLTHGTTGRYHGLLHSGGRYVVKDPQAAIECIEENRILRRIMPECIEDTGGFFVLTPWDDPDFVTRFVSGCAKAGIPCEELPISVMLHEETLLNPQISRCFRVPDGSADSFLAADLNADSAKEYSAVIFPYHKVLRLLTDGNSNQGSKRVVGALCLDRIKDEEVTIFADLIVNASGAWAGKIAETAGINLTIIGGKGVMVAMNHRIVNTVINRCKMPSDGDILVPAHTVSVIGTTDVRITDPDQIRIEPWEINLCLEEGDKLVPGFKNMRMLRAWAGVRPLYQETDVTDTRNVSRAFVLLDHSSRDGIDGLVTITSGKWTTYRKMAEVTTDLVCQKLGVTRACRTHLEPLPQAGDTHPSLSARLSRIEREKSYGNLICECELATEQDVIHAIVDRKARTLDDIRRDTRLGMGPCQGGFCTYRAAGMLHRFSQDNEPDGAEKSGANAALGDFLQERWKGLLPILWGQQLRQERLDELIYLDVLNTDHLPGPTSSTLAAEMYSAPKVNEVESMPTTTLTAMTATSPVPVPSLDVVVIGGGLSGLVTAWQSSSRGKKVRLVTKGWGALHWGSGCMDVLGYDIGGNQLLLDSPMDGIQRLIHSNPDHPYARISLEEISSALEAFQEVCQRAGYPLHGSLERNWVLPSALGSFRPTCLAPETMVAGDCHQPGSMLIIGFKQYPDFYPEWLSSNISKQGIDARGITLDIPSLRSRRFVTGRVLASLFETQEFREEVTRLIKPGMKNAERVGFPAVLGLHHARTIKEDMERILGRPVFEIPTLPPSIPGIRLHEILVSKINKTGGRVYEGMEAQLGIVHGDHLVEIQTEAAARWKSHPAHAYVLATGGTLGGGYRAEYAGTLRETILGIPTDAPRNRSHWFMNGFLSVASHPIYSAGISLNNDFQPIDLEGRIIFDNLWVVGSAMGHCDPIRERSLEGIALSSGYLTGTRIG